MGCWHQNQQRYQCGVEDMVYWHGLFLITTRIAYNKVKDFWRYLSTEYNELTKSTNCSALYFIISIRFFRKEVVLTDGCTYGCTYLVVNNYNDYEHGVQASQELINVRL